MFADSLVTGFIVYEKIEGMIARGCMSETLKINVFFAAFTFAISGIGTVAIDDSAGG
jgi:hypothetical protein